MKRVSSFLFGLMIHALAVVWMSGFLFASPVQAGDQPAWIVASGDDTAVQVSNLRDVSFSLSWTTDAPVTSAVHYGITPELGQIAVTSAQPSRIHHVTLADLTPETTYYFAVVSGGVVDDNGGQLYQVTTGPVLDVIPPSDALWGRVFSKDGSPAVGAL
ncbi:MAG: fibronectin type III domain-containing protein, partial [Anaerolineae bacterium]|nr:fibronectin type III domain-containing protein [Anaerolineae bacterium]